MLASDLAQKAGGGFQVKVALSHFQRCVANVPGVTRQDGSQIPVAEGSATSLSGLEKVPAAFVHGEDGFGNTNQAAVEVRRLPYQEAG